MKRSLILFLACLAGSGIALSLTGCTTVAEVGATVGQATGKMTPEQAESFKRGAKAIGKTLEDITPEQEYYIGRSVAASILRSYDVVDDPQATRYLNQVGQAIGMVSDKPYTFKGYRFLILQSDEINAFACPGGLILVSSGMLGLCESEDDLAAVLAHEVAHVQLEHGLKAIKKSRLTSALTILAAESAKNFGGEQLASLTDAFEGSISDITSTLVNKGYARTQEYQADRIAVDIMDRLGYDPSALVHVLERMSSQLEHDHRGFAATHPPADDRIAKASEHVEQAGTIPVPDPTRIQRFKRALGRS